jgi:hypothetical protein
LVVHGYYSAGGKNLILKYIDGLSCDERVDGYSVLQCMEEDRLEEVTCKRWRDKISEVYFYKYNRIFYVIIDNNDIYLLHACKKQKNKTEQKDSDIVLRRAIELGKKLNRKFVR